MKASKILVLLIIGATLFSCAKEEDTPAPVATTPTPTAAPAPGNTTGNAQPNFVGADATMWAVNSLTNTTVVGTTITTTIGTGVGVFLDGSGSFVDVGAVQLNSNALTLNPNNSYVFVPGTSMPTGISFTGGVNWSVVGGNGFPAITKNLTLAFPTVSEITSSATVTKANGYTLSVSTVTGADSVLFLVGGIDKTIPGNATSCTFSASELSGLADGTTVVQVAAYTSTSETLSGKLIYYGNETVQSKTTTVE